MSLDDDILALYTQKIQDLDERISEYERLINHLKEHDCKALAWEDGWLDVHKEAIKADGDKWYYEWYSGLNASDGKVRTMPVPSPAEAKALASKAAHAFAAQVQKSGVAKFEDLQEVVFRKGKLHGYTQG